MTKNGKTNPAGTSGAADPAPNPKAGAASGQRTFASQAELDAAVLNELFWPVSLVASFHESMTSKAGAKLAYEQYLAAAGSPTDPVARMLLEELWLAHYQVAEFHVRAAKASNPEVTKIFGSAAVRLMGEIRRMALSLRQYRLPPGKKSFTAISQQNIVTDGGTQEVSYVAGPEGKATLGATDKVQDNPAPDGDLHAQRERIVRGQEPQAGGSRSEERATATAVDR